MARSLNFTGRKDIKLKYVDIRIEQSDDLLTFSSNLQLDHYKFPADARVYIEAYRGLSALWKRFDFGRVGLFEAPEDRSLNDFDHPEGILFRVKVSADGEHQGRLLGNADGIRPKRPGQDKQPGVPLIDVDSAPMKGALWCIRYPEFDSDMPTLVMNEKIDDWNSRARDPLFRAVVLPEVMRQILTRILIIDAEISDEDEPDCWQQKWLRFAESLPNISDHPEPLQAMEDLMDRVELSDWIEDAVNAFGKSQD